MVSPAQAASEFADNLVPPSDRDQIWGAFHAFARRFGFEIAFYLDIPVPGQSLEECMIAMSGGEEWSRHYVRENYVAKDPLWPYARRVTRPFTFNEWHRSHEYACADIDIAAEASRFGIRNGYFIPLRSPRNLAALIGLTGEKPEFAPEVLIAVHSAALAADLALRPCFGTGARLDTPSLSRRERECLQLMAIGKGDPEIGTILGISEKTANFHVENIKRKFQASSRTLAVVRAVQAGVLHPPAA